VLLFVLAIRAGKEKRIGGSCPDQSSHRSVGSIEQNGASPWGRVKGESEYASLGTASSFDECVCAIQDCRCPASALGKTSS